MSAHTAGPWRFMLISEKSWNVGVYDNTGSTIATIKVPSKFSAPRHDANARLIAAAPELLEALERSLNWLCSYPGEGAMNAYDQARAAIAKATEAA